MSLGFVSLVPASFTSPEAPPLEQIHHQEAESLLRRSPYLALRNVSCEDHGDRLILRGHLPCYYLKQLAHPTIAAAAGGRQIVNEIEVINRAARR